MTGKSRPMSSKIQIALIMMIFIIPLTGLLVVYNLYNVNNLNRRVAETNQNITLLYKRSIERELADVGNYLANFLANDSDSLRLRYAVEDLNLHVLGVNIVEKFRITMEPKEMLAGLFFYSQQNNLRRMVYNRNYSFQNKAELEAFFTSTVADESDAVKQGWFFKQVGGHPMLLRILGGNGIYSMCAVDLDYVETPQSIGETGGAFLFFAGDAGQAVTELVRVEKYSMAVRRPVEDYYITGDAGSRYFMVQSPVSGTGLTMLYAAPYRGALMNMDGVQLTVLIGSGLILLLIGFSFYFLKRFYLKPLDSLVRTMEQVREGRLDAKAEAVYQNDEFARLNNTFNRMMEEIQNLKIASYEQHIEIQQAQLQYLQIQIRPHFFLNCLKNLYALVQEQRYDQTQEMILALSRHLRYMFRDDGALAPLEKELKNVENYMLLQQMSTRHPPACSFEVDERLRDMELPPLSLLTFVENSVKYGAVAGKTLQIFTRLSLLEDKDDSFVSLAVRDNGNGFSPEILEKLNGERVREGDAHIGIQNVCQRFRLIYGEKCSFLFSNRAGAEIELFFPYRPKGDKNATIAPGSANREE